MSNKSDYCLLCSSTRDTPPPFCTGPMYGRRVREEFRTGPHCARRRGSSWRAAMLRAQAEKSRAPLHDGGVDLETGVVGMTMAPKEHAQTLFRGRLHYWLALSSHSCEPLILTCFTNSQGIQSAFQRLAPAVRYLKGMDDPSDGPKWPTHLTNRTKPKQLLCRPPPTGVRTRACDLCEAA